MILVGLARLGRDAELRYTPSGEPVCNLSLAVPYGRRDETGKQPTEWYKAALWGQRAEKLAPYLRKGEQHCFTLEDIHVEPYQGSAGPGYNLVARVADVELMWNPNSQQQPARASAAKAEAVQQEFEDPDIPF